MKSRVSSLAPLAFLVVLLTSVAAQAQDDQNYPARPIHVVVGPGPDLAARILGQKVAEVLGQGIVIDARPGAGGIIAAQTVATAKPDGYTLLLASASFTINTALQVSPHDLRTDFTPVALLTTSPFVLVVHPSVPAHSVAELIALAKAQPGKLNYASAGVGTPPHLAGELFKSTAGVDIVHVPFREANSALNAVIGGSVEMMFSIATTAQSQIASGTLRGLGVTTPQTSPIVPNLQPIAQSGLPGFDVVGWNGLVAPLGTPEPVVAKLNAAVMRGLQDPEIRQWLAVSGYDPAAQNTPNQFASFINGDTQKWIDLVEKSHISVK